MKKIISKITVNNKKYSYSLEKKKNNIMHVKCDDAKIDQDFLMEDVANLVIDLPSLIIAEKQYSNNQSETVRFRISSTDKAKIEKLAIKNGYASVSDYIRYRVLT